MITVKEIKVYTFTCDEHDYHDINAIECYQHLVNIHNMDATAAAQVVDRMLQGMLQFYATLK